MKNFKLQKKKKKIYLKNMKNWNKKNELLISKTNQLNKEIYNKNEIINKIFNLINNKNNFNNIEDIINQEVERINKFEDNYLKNLNKDLNDLDLLKISLTNKLKKIKIENSKLEIENNNLDKEKKLLLLENNELNINNNDQIKKLILFLNNFKSKNFFNLNLIFNKFNNLFIKFQNKFEKKLLNDSNEKMNYFSKLKKSKVILNELRKSISIITKKEFPKNYLKDNKKLIFFMNENIKLIE